VYVVHVRASRVAGTVHMEYCTRSLLLVSSFAFATTAFSLLAVRVDDGDAAAASCWCGDVGYVCKQLSLNDHRRYQATHSSTRRVAAVSMARTLIASGTDTGVAPLRRRLYGRRALMWDCL
jgi:hypothetical protein